VNVKFLTSSWGEALLIVCHIHNRIPSRKLKVSPYKLWNKTKSKLNYLRGCLAFYRVSNPKRMKLRPRVLKSNFVGYAENSKAYKILELSSNIIVESRDIKFIENKS
jgi:hypothetical protein